jgi:hypothetical protein
MQTDTASVLMEAIGYIKFLQGQVEVPQLIYFPNVDSLVLYLITFKISMCTSRYIHYFLHGILTPYTIKYQFVFQKHFS